MAGNRCGHQRCNNPIRNGQAYCHLHGGASAAELDSGVGRGPGSITMGELDEIRARRREAKLRPAWAVVAGRPPSLSDGPTPLDRAVSAYTRHTRAAPDAVAATLRASRRVLGLENIAIPADAARLRARVGDLAQAIGDDIGHDRVSVVEMRGLARKTATRSRLLSPSATHKVLMIDRGTDHEVIVDPFIAGLAPVANDVATRPVEHSGMRGVSLSPYVDGPWIGDAREYKNNAYIEWSSASLVSA